MSDSNSRRSHVTGLRDDTEVPEGGGLEAYVRENREDVELLADADLPISPLFQRFLDRYDAGEL